MVSRGGSGFPLSRNVRGESIAWDHPSLAPMSRAHPAPIPNQAPQKSWLFIMMWIIVVPNLIKIWNTHSRHSHISQFLGQKNRSPNVVCHIQREIHVIPCPFPSLTETHVPHLEIRRLSTQLGDVSQGHRAWSGISPEFCCEVIIFYNT